MMNTAILLLSALVYGQNFQAPQNPEAQSPATAAAQQAAEQAKKFPEPLPDPASRQPETPPPPPPPQQNQNQNQGNNNPPPPKKSTTTMTTVTTVIEEPKEVKVIEPKPVLTSFDLDVKNVKKVVAKGQDKKDILAAFCDFASLAGCDMSIMKPIKELKSETMAMMAFIDNTADKYENALATIFYSQKTLTRKEAVDLVNGYALEIPGAHPNNSPSRITSLSKMKRRSSLVLLYEWTVDNGPQVFSKMFVLKHPKTEESYVIFIAAPTKSHLTTSPMFKFISTDLDAVKK